MNRWIAGDTTGQASGRGVLEGAFSLLEELTRLEDVGLTYLATSAGLPKATAHRLLDQLVALGAVHRRDGRYRIGSRMFHLGQSWQPVPALRAAAHLPVRQLAAAMGRASVHVSMPEAGNTVVIAGIAGEAGKIFQLRVGAVFRPGSLADILIAADTPNAARPERYSPREWHRLVTGAREQGIAVNPFTQACCVAAPIRAASGEVVAALGAAVLDTGRLNSLSSAVKRAASMINANLARSALRT